MPIAKSASRPFRLRAGAAACVALAAALVGGCSGRFSVETEYLAPDFNQESLRGRSVAVLPPESMNARAPDPHEGELTGVARAIRAVGAQVRVLQPTPATAATVPGKGWSVRRGDAAMVDTGAAGSDDRPLDPDTLRAAAQRWGRETGAAYLLVVRVTDADVYRKYTPRHERGASTRTTGRRLGLQLALVRLPDGEPVWVARGTGHLWRRRSGPASGADSAAEELRTGNLYLYPEPPPPQAVSSRLTSRLLARLPIPVELQPN